MTGAKDIVPDWNEEEEERNETIEEEQEERLIVIIFICICYNTILLHSFLLICTHSGACHQHSC